VIVLAGGFGTRIRHLLPDVPKPMAPVAGRPFVEWVVRFFARFGCTDFLLSTGYLAEVVEAHFATGPVAGVNVVCRQETSPMGTGGGALHALPEENSPNRIWLVVNGDSLALADPRPLWSLLENPDIEAALLGVPLEDAGRFGSLDIGQGGVLRAFREKQPGAGVINAGVYAIRESCLRSLPDRRPLSFELDVFPALAARNCVRVLTASVPMLDIGTPETLAQAENFITSHQSEFL
jgi:D-glycero-alpha-D-manno-heptose 1-phosphate guanylyltransferase